MHEAPAYGLWSLVIINSALFLFFALSYCKPKTTRDGRTFGTAVVDLREIDQPTPVGATAG